MMIIITMAIIVRIVSTPSDIALVVCSVMLILMHCLRRRTALRAVDDNFHTHSVRRQGRVDVKHVIALPF